MNDFEVWVEVFGSYNVCFDYKFKDYKFFDGWYVVLFVRVKSIEKLMKCGFYVIEVNVWKYNGFVIIKYYDDWFDFMKIKWKVMRVFDVGDFVFV